MRLTHRGEYPPDWDAIGDRVRAENGNRCIRCGHPQGDRPGVESDDDWAYSGRMECGEPKRKVHKLIPCTSLCTHARDGKLRILTVHHCDGNKANCHWWNLLALCQVCHLQIQAKVIPERAYLWEHAAWFKPYVAGFYAFWFAGLDVSRAEVEADIDRHLAMGQPWLYEEIPT